MNCPDIREKLQLFLEDLLAEEEYKAFCVHIDNCNRCKVYVRSIGSLSNQLWKLGQIEAPSDLLSTIQFKLTHAQENGRMAKTRITKKQVILSITLLILTIALILGAGYFKKRRQKPPSESESKALINELKGIAVKLGVSAGDDNSEKETGNDTTGN
ncbi:MAG TPA: zf-HC2 domain-containing protein [Candidatus Margulisiibacteriota bacterium]|nr:zf-HC2 domain-containing protein [Candidatus Margulisiibacteriota bacterium]